MTKVDDKFVYETEKANCHNKLLKQIQFGVKLKPTKTNDRSKPQLDGLRKFRRQMTIEEQLQKSESKAQISAAPAITSGGSPPQESSGDELDDIDKVRDDLQSTKQMLALELRNREATERENKRLLAKIANLEAELEREKWTLGANGESLSTSKLSDEALVKSLKKDADEARLLNKEMETKYQAVAEELDVSKTQVEEQKRQIAALEKKLQQALQVSLGFFLFLGTAFIKLLLYKRATIALSVRRNIAFLIPLKTLRMSMTSTILTIYKIRLAWLYVLCVWLGPFACLKFKDIYVRSKKVSSKSNIICFRVEEDPSTPEDQARHILIRRALQN